MNFFSSRLSNQAGAHFAKTLDALQACVMLVDESLTITYVNSALSRMMQDAAAELRRDLPHFNAATLVGANMDIFHKSPSHQRQILTTLTGPHATSIAIGPRVFDVVITPVMANKRRTGFVIEWVDARERLQNANYIGTMQALSRTQAIIEFDTDGIILDANDKFLQTMGYRLDEIKGQHHSLFVDPQTRQSQDLSLIHI